jgi:diguanylate cyclase (GGDEF)-like protein
MLRMTKKLLQQALDLSAAATVILDPDGARIVYANAAMESLLGCPTGALQHRHVAGLRAGGAELVLDARPDGHAASQPIRWRVGDGKARDLQVHTAALTDDRGQLACWLLTAVSEPSDAGSTGAAGTPTPSTDAATGLPDRAAFEQALARDWAAGRRVRSRVSLLLFRIDAFPAYREVFGRHAADSCLRKVGHAIGGCLRRDADLVARYSEDQFVAMVGGADEEQAGEFAQRIADRVRLLAIHHPRSVTDRFVTVTWSVAVSSPGLQDSYRKLLASAETGLPGAQAESLAAGSG